MPLEVASRKVERIAVLKCTGRIVAGAESTALHDHIKKHQPEYNQFVLNLNDVQFVDSSGLGLLVRVLCGVRAVRGDLKLCCVPATIQSVLQLTKLAPMFDQHPSEEAALAAFHLHSALGTRASLAHASILCIEKSSDLLAYVREVLRHSGYEPLTTTNVSDAVVLLKSAKPRLVVIGPGLLHAEGVPVERFRAAAAGIPTIEIEAELVTGDPSHAANEILRRVQAALGSKSAAQA